MSQQKKRENLPENTGYTFVKPQVTIFVNRINLNILFKLKPEKMSRRPFLKQRDRFIKKYKKAAWN